MGKVGMSWVVVDGRFGEMEVRVSLCIAFEGADGGKGGV
jgi:hypothetical protein